MVADSNKFVQPHSYDLAWFCEGVGLAAGLGRCGPSYEFLRNCHLKKYVCMIFHKSYKFEQV